jgi:glycosyltransferase involved in cell wall biosynthesis
MEFFIEVDSIPHVSMFKKSRPSICFATMCKNEEHCIRETLESVYKYIDYWVVSDTGSTDRTCEIVETFFKEKGIPGALFNDEWVGFDVNKTKLFEHCYKKADYILHLDADDLIQGYFSFTNEDAGNLQYHCWAKRGENSVFKYKISLMFYNHVHWKFCGVAHTTIKCLDESTTELSGIGDLTNKNFVMVSRDSGNRSADPEKYRKDALILTEQFFNTLVDDPDGLNRRSAFYTAQSYNDCGDFKNSARWYSLYIEMKDTWLEEVFESHLKLGGIFQTLEYSFKKIEREYLTAISMFPDRAEPYFYLGKFYNHNKEWTKGYDILNKAQHISLASAKRKYVLFINENAYEKHVLDELSVSCFWIGRYREGKEILLKIINDPEFIEHKERLGQNMKFFNERIEKSEKETALEC